MAPDPTSRPVNRAPRGLAWLLAGLALVAVVAAGSSWHDHVTAARSESAPTPATAASPDARAATSEPTPSTHASPSRTASSKRTGSPALTDVSAEPARPVGGIHGPFTLRIPRIGVSARVIPIQTGADRVLNPPRDPSIAGWWSQGAAPGQQQGSAVIVGHTVRNHGGGVFDDVGLLGSGDAIEVDGAGSAVAYSVQSTAVLSKDEFARDAEQIFAQAGPGRLVIITCDDFDGKVWRSNIITIATPA